MAKGKPDLSQRMTTPWVAFGLAVGGGALMSRDIELMLRLAGALLAISGAALLAVRTWRSRETMARVLAAIPIEDKSETLLRKLPKAWAALEHENLALRTQAEAEDQIRRHILFHLKAGVVLLGQDRRVRIFNPAAQAMLGVSSNLEEGGAMVAAFREPESLRRLEDAYRGTPAEWILLRNPRTLQVRALPFPDPFLPDTLHAWVLVTVDDITRQEALETTRQKFISNASHELKTPVTSIRIAVENLQEGAMVSAEAEGNLKIILRSLDRMTMLLDDISELSRIETGALRLAPVPLRLEGFLADLLGNLKGQAAARAVNLRTRLSPQLAGRMFEADPLRLTQLLENLLSNAIKFSPAGGAEVTLEAGLVGPWLAWTVADQGPGISAEDARRVFERFYRAPTVRAIPGTGLGLAIVKHLALLMGGEVSLQSEPGHGTVFTFRMPWIEARPEAHAGPAPARSPEAPCPAP